MENPEWFLRVVVDRMGGPKNMLDWLNLNHPEITTECSRWFPHITGDLLAHVLGYTDLKDTLSVMCVCKSWHKATQKEHFWKRRIYAAKIRALRPSIGNDIKYQAQMSFDTFSSPVSEVLRDQVEWVFKRGRWIETIVRENGSVCVSRRATRGVNDYEYDDAGLLIAIIWNDFNGEIVRKNLVLPASGLRLLKKTDGDTKGNGLIETGSYIYSGQLWISTKQIWVPHGDGKWTFTDGSILEGEGVAYKGEPRYLEPIQKRRRGSQNEHS